MPRRIQNTLPSGAYNLQYRFNVHIGLSFNAGIVNRAANRFTSLNNYNGFSQDAPGYSNYLLYNYRYNLNVTNTTLPVLIQAVPSTPRITEIRRTWNVK